MDLNELVEMVKEFNQATFEAEPNGQNLTLIFTYQIGIGIKVFGLEPSTKEELQFVLKEVLARSQPQFYVLSSEGRMRVIPLDDEGLEHQLRVRSTDPELIIVAGTSRGGHSISWTAEIERSRSRHRKLSPWEQGQLIETNTLILDW